MKRLLAATLLAATACLTACQGDPMDMLQQALPDVNITGLGNGKEGSNKVTPEEFDKAVANVNFLHVDDHPRPPKKYDRQADFGPAWTDKHTAALGGNGCDTRNDILTRDLVDIEYQDTKRCVVLTGTLEHDPYTGRPIDFRRGKTTSSAIQIDHIVALSNAWQSGAWRWTPEERVNFANDPDNLIAADGPENNAKSDKPADQWLVPNNPDYRCTYAAKQVNLKASYSLTVTSAEQRALQRQLEVCKANR